MAVEIQLTEDLKEQLRVYEFTWPHDTREQARDRTRNFALRRDF